MDAISPDSPSAAPVVAQPCRGKAESFGAALPAAEGARERSARSVARRHGIGRGQARPELRELQVADNATYGSSPDKMGMQTDQTASMKIPSLKQFCCANMLALVFSLAGFGQVAQTSPELCGKSKDTILEVPENVHLTLSDGGTTPAARYF